MTRVPALVWAGQQVTFEPAWRSAVSYAASMLRVMTSTTIANEVLAAPDVAGAAREAWRVIGEAAEVVDWVIVAESLKLDHGDAIRTAVLVPRLMQVECVLDPAAALQDARQNLAALLAEGWRVSALIPISEMGAAHEALRGLDLHLQGWWTTAEGCLRFSSPETP